MNISRLRSVLAAGATAIGTASICIAANTVDVPLPETGMPALVPIVQSALAKSPRTMTRDFAVLQAEYQEMINSARLYPQVGGSYQFQVRSEDQGLGDGQEATTRTYYNLNISQTLWHWGSVRAAAHIGEIGTKIAQQDLAGARRALAVEVRDAYLALILQKMGVRNARYADRLLQATLERQEARFKASEITLGVLTDIRLRADESSLGVNRAASDLEFAVRAFRRLTGVEGFGEADIPDAIAIPALEPTAVGPELHKGYLQSESLVSNELQLEQAKLDNLIDRRLLWPKLNAIAGLSQDDRLYSPTQGTITSTAAFVGIQLQWTIFDGFSARGQKLQSLNRIKQLKDSREDLMDTLRNSADQQAANVGFTWEYYKNRKTRMEMARGSVAYETDNLKRGQSSEERVANAQAAFNQAELTANDALAKFYSAAARYASTMSADPLIDGPTGN